MSEINNMIIAEFSANTSARKIASQQNVKVNGILFDCEFTPTSAYLSGDKFAFYKSITVDLVLRRGGSNAGQNHLVIDSVSLYQLLNLSDYLAGVSVKATASDEMVADSPFRISGYIDLGFFSMETTDTLDIELYTNTNLTVGGTVRVSSVYVRDQLAVLKKYSSALPTGSDQSYNNVLAIYGDSTNKMNGTVTVRDEVGGSLSVNIEDAIALSNAVGNFEVFTRFGELYSDPYGVGQNVTTKSPVEANSDFELLIVGFIYDLDMLGNSASTWEANKSLLFTKIINQGGDKLDYLRALGIV